MRYYAAYGSNLNMRQMAHRCPDAEPVTKLTLPNYRLVFRGVADVEHHEGARVHLGIWRITKRCEKALDRYEGYRNHAPKHGLYRKAYLPFRYRGDRHEALIYLMNRDWYSPPDAHYLEVIRQGYEDFGFPVDALEDAALYDPDRRNNLHRPIDII